MSFQLAGANGTAAQVEVNTQALRSNAHPVDVSSAGSYACSLSSGTVAAATFSTAAVGWACRWTSATISCLVRRLNVSLTSLSTGFTAGQGIFQVFFVTGYNAAGSSGATATLTGRNCKKKSTFGTTNMTEIRVSTTGALTGQTWQVDTQGQAITNYGINATTNLQQLATTDLIVRDPTSWCPVLSQNEGLALYITTPATGTCAFTVTFEWDEVPSSGSGY